MKQRIITGLILAIGVICGVFFLPLKFFVLFSMGVYLLASKEWCNFISKIPNKLYFYFFALALAITIVFIPIDKIWVQIQPNPLLIYTLILGSLWWCVSLFMVYSYPKTSPKWKDNIVLKQLFGFLTLIPFFWGMILLRSVQMELDFYFGAKLLMFVFLIVWAADSGAYFIGKAIGKNKLAPRVSPGKTIEGFLGGAACSLLVTFIGSIYFDISSEKLAIFMLAGLITNVVSALGDLNESIFKREAGLKDSGKLLPGHGGILDRIDSLTAAVPVFALIYVYWLL